LAVKQINDLVWPLVTRTLTGSLLSESVLVKSQLMKQLRVVQLLLHILSVNDVGVVVTVAVVMLTFSSSRSFCCHQIADVFYGVKQSAVFWRNIWVSAGRAGSRYVHQLHCLV